MALNILVTDDSEIMRNMIIRTLQMTGIPIGEIGQAANGKEALERLESAWVDLLVVDVNMPVMTGLELLAEVRKRCDFAKLPVVVVTSDSSDTVRDRVESAAATAYVRKPFTPERFKAAVSALVGEVKA